MRDEIKPQVEEIIKQLPQKRRRYQASLDAASGHPESPTTLLPALTTGQLYSYWELELESVDWAKFLLPLSYKHYDLRCKSCGKPIPDPKNSAIAAIRTGNSSFISSLQIILRHRLINFSKD